jgi:hypothetical protein
MGRISFTVKVWPGNTDERRYSCHLYDFTAGDGVLAYGATEAEAEQNARAKAKAELCSLVREWSEETANG